MTAVAPAPLLEFVPGDDRWHALRARARSDLYWFNGVVLNYGDKVHMTPKVHWLMCRFAARQTGIPEIDSAPHRKVTVPREIGKTTLLTQGYALWRIIQNPNIAIMVANEKLENAVSYLRSIKFELMHNQLLRELFPDIIPRTDQETTWKEDKINVLRDTGRKEETVFCIGVGGTVTGAHPDLIICDDLFSREAMENARTGNADLTGKINRWISQLKPLLNAWAEPYPEILFIGTKWYAGDPYEYVEDAFGYGEDARVWQVTQKLADGATAVMPLERKGDLAIFKRSIIEDGRSIWPENPKFTDEALAKFRLTDPELFAANMMNEPSDDLTAVFKDAWLRYYDWLDATTVRVHRLEGRPCTVALQEMDCLMLVDPGGFSGQRGGDRAQPAVVVTGTTPDGDHLLLEAWSEQVTYKQAIDKLLALTTRYRLRRIGVEVAGQQAAFLDLAKQGAKDRGLALSWEPLKPKSIQKEQRILVLEPYFQRGQMYVGKGAAFTEFREQYRTFPRGRRSDLLDVLAYGPDLWRRSPLTGPRSTEQRHALERQLYYQRRGLAPVAPSFLPSRPTIVVPH